ncbi:hypothetical protein [Azospirillum doebereinerae]|uniref:Uncharacterized protein n=1 Tax=Azospirillum doebereinerae TaxID=92933 RepID=A0A433J250_9PROT|nr:hypothetical protein [Azospirillum doebereinerae]RUQ65178.1 hypothetical protein EJ913_25880 [Azospirillum doebereinerae]
MTMDNLPIPDVGDTIVRLAGLSPNAQVAAVIMIGLIGLAWVWTRRPPSGPGMETFQLVINSLNEQSKATNALAEQVERIVEQNAALIARLPVKTMEPA